MATQMKLKIAMAALLLGSPSVAFANHLLTAEFSSLGDCERFLAQLRPALKSDNRNYRCEVIGFRLGEGPVYGVVHD